MTELARQAPAADDGTPVVVPEFVTTRRRRRGGVGALLAAAWIGLVLVAAITADWLPLPDPNEIGDQYSAQPFADGHLLGTDALGRDTLSRLVFGARVSLAVAIGATAIALVVGVTLGMLSGYFRGPVDATISLLVNFVLSFPPLIFLIALVAALRPGVTTLVAGLALLGMPNFARVARANTIAFADREFVVAAKALGAGPGRILVRELLVNVMLPVMSLALVVLATLVVAEGSLSFLGLGVPPPTPSWGGMLAAGREALGEHPHLVLVPAVCFFLTVFAFNTLGDWARRRVGKESAL
jgi:peptide/nickel transport system permease protein